VAYFSAGATPDQRSRRRSLAPLGATRLRSANDRRTHRGVNSQPAPQGQFSTGLDSVDVTEIAANPAAVASAFLDCSGTLYSTTGGLRVADRGEQQRDLEIIPEWAVKRERATVSQWTASRSR